jgi:putative membrane protein
VDSTDERKPAADLRDFLAEERTFLAWIRTSLALMGFGFVVARFGLFLQALQITRSDPAALAQTGNTGYIV